MWDVYHATYSKRDVKELAYAELSDQFELPIAEIILSMTFDKVAIRTSNIPSNIVKHFDKMFDRMFDRFA